MGCLTVSDIGELELVERILGKLSALNSDVQIGPGDDAAVLSIGGSVVLTTDSQHEGIHYCAEWIAPEVLGRRAIAVNASDLGAMGARPRGFLVALALPASTELDWVVSLAEGLREGAERFGASILGGDVAAVANHVSINVTALGEIEEGTDPVERGGAAEGTWCFVTGWPGRAAAARRMFKTGYRSSAAFEPCIDAFLDPRPPVAFGGCVASQGLVGAMIDISDGLAVDLGRMCLASGVGARLDAEILVADTVLVDVSAGLSLDPIKLVLGGGEDYELLCSVADEKAQTFRALAAEEGVEVRAVGRFVAANKGITFVRAGHVETISRDGWDHFA
ncbi:MAG TPA: thiamine-phosphate kinase [Acidobacteriota bacterium]|nr:thiamine-phosphate kinase [Acidobacteriota bacterium]